MLCIMRISLPDRPGVLAAVSAALGQTGTDIVTLDVIDRIEGVAIDDLCVNTAEDYDGLCLETPDEFGIMLRHVIEDVPGVFVEVFRPIESPRSLTAPLELAAKLASTETDRLALLVAQMPEALWASWCAVVDLAPDAHLIASSRGAPLDEIQELLRVPLLFAHAAQRMDPGLWMPPAWRMRASMGAFELAAVPLDTTDRILLLARHSGVRFRPSELRNLQLLVDIAAAVIQPSADTASAAA